MPSGRVKVSEKVNIWPADADTGGSSFLAADLGSFGTSVGPDPGPEGAASGRSTEMGNWMWGWGGLEVWITVEVGGAML